VFKIECKSFYLLRTFAAI